VRFLAGLALFFLGLHLVAEALWAWKGRRGLLARVLGSPFLGLLYGLLLGAFSGSGSGLGLLALALLEVGVLTHAQAALLALAATAGAGVWVGLLAVARERVWEALLVLALFLYLVPAVRRFSLFLFGLGLLFLGFAEMGAGLAPVLALAQRLSGLGEGYLVGLLLGGLLGSANGVAALALLLSGKLTPGVAEALVLGAGVGTTSTFLLAALGGRVEALRLGVPLFLHRLLLSLLLLPLVPPLADGVLAWHLLRAPPLRPPLPAPGPLLGKAGREAFPQAQGGPQVPAP
jgi:phosphate:Na+ symporter